MLHRDWLGRLVLTEHLAAVAEAEDLRLVLKDQFPKELQATSADSKRGMRYDIRVWCRRLPER
jgi:hypothetical protein